jgi:hypothetical protein
MLILRGKIVGTPSGAPRGPRRKVREGAGTKRTRRTRNPALQNELRTGFLRVYKTNAVCNLKMYLTPIGYGCCASVMDSVETLYAVNGTG